MKVLLLAATSFLLAFTRGRQSTTCPPGWESWFIYCYLFVNASAVSWENARTECRTIQAHLLRIESTQEYDFVKKTQRLHISSAYWTDLNSRSDYQPNSKFRTFMWGEDEHADDTIVKNHWDSEPDNTDFEDCVSITVQGTLSIEDCNELHPYVCQLNKLTSGENCPRDWLNAPNVCLYISNPAVWSMAVTWDVARRNCEEMAPFQNDPTRTSQLLAITTTSLQVYMEEVLPAILNTRVMYWTGLNDRNTEGLFLWAGNDGIPLNSSIINWRVEPDNLGGSEYCGALIPGGMWSDRDCADEANYICRKSFRTHLYNYGCGDWMRAGQKCIYLYNSPKKSWQDAQSFCQSMDGDLLRFDNMDDANWIEMQTMTRSGMVLPGYWIGLNDIQTEGTFLWTDGTEPPGYILNWDREPNGAVIAFNQNCAVMGVDGKFLDNDCRYAQAGTICEEDWRVCGVGNWEVYNRHCYLFDTSYKEHGEAQAFCRDNSGGGNGRLVVISTLAEKQWLMQLMNTLMNAPYYYWVDLEDDNLVGPWHWIHSDGEKPLPLDQILIWSREPNNWGHNEDCVQVLYGGFLNDVNCADKTGFVCQRYIGKIGSGSGGSVIAMRTYLVVWSLISCVTSVWMLHCL